MTTSELAPIFNNIKDEIENLIASSIKKHANEITSDALKFFEDTKSVLERWSTLYKDGAISEADLNALILGQKELMEMHALKQAGLSAITADELKENLLNILVKNIIKII